MDRTTTPLMVNVLPQSGWKWAYVRRVVFTSVVVFNIVIQHLAASTAWAKPLAQDPTGSIGAKIDQVSQSLATLGRPLAVLSVVLGLIAYLLEPVLPDWARENRGVIAKSILCAIAIGLAPDIVGFFVS